MKNILTYKILISLSMLLAVGFACTKKEPIGPSINDLYGPFTIAAPFNTSSPTVDFTITTPFYFTAGFSKVKSWTIMLNGQTSGATKTITGVSSVIDVSTARWDGLPDNLYAFQKEVVKAKLTIEGFQDTLFTDFTITQTVKVDTSLNVLISDFSKIPLVQNYGSGTILPTSWASDFPRTDNIDKSHSFIDGNAYLIMGNPTAPWKVNSGPYVDILTITPSTSMTPNPGDPTHFHLYEDATKVFFSIWVYNTGTPTWLQAGFLENGNVARTLDIKPDWTGWKLITKRYSDLTPTSDTYATSIQSNNITGVQFVLLSNTPGATSVSPGPAVNAVFDHPIFTIGGPYQP